MKVSAALVLSAFLVATASATEVLNTTAGNDPLQRTDSSVRGGLNAADWSSSEDETAFLPFADTENAEADVAAQQRPYDHAYNRLLLQVARMQHPDSVGRDLDGYAEDLRGWDYGDVLSLYQDLRAGARAEQPHLVRSAMQHLRRHGLLTDHKATLDLLSTYSKTDLDHLLELLSVEHLDQETLVNMVADMRPDIFRQSGDGGVDPALSELTEVELRELYGDLMAPDGLGAESSMDEAHSAPIQQGDDADNQGEEDSPYAGWGGEAAPGPQRESLVHHVAVLQKYTGVSNMALPEIVAVLSTLPDAELRSMLADMAGESFEPADIPHDDLVTFAADLAQLKDPNVDYDATVADMQFQTDDELLDMLRMQLEQWDA